MADALLRNEGNPRPRLAYAATFVPTGQWLCCEFPCARGVLRALHLYETPRGLVAVLRRLCTDSGIPPRLYREWYTVRRLDMAEACRINERLMGEALAAFKAPASFSAGKDL